MRRGQTAAGTATARPFLKWAGGKGHLVAAIARRVESMGPFERYIEPFVGAGAFFFYLRSRRPELACRLADTNAWLIETYRVVRDEVDALVERLRTYAANHSAEQYYAVRAERPATPVERAAQLLYLNRTCYNGLFRVNRRGLFNVPLGRYRRPRILDEETLRRAAAALSGTELLCADFEAATADAGPGDLVYLDPPYAPVSPTSRFTAYTPAGFGPAEQERLARRFAWLARRGARVVLSNSAAPAVRRLYESLAPRPRIEVVRAPRAINARGDRRGAVDELLVWTP